MVFEILIFMCNNVAAAQLVECDIGAQGPRFDTMLGNFFSLQFLLKRKLDKWKKKKKKKKKKNHNNNSSNSLVFGQLQQTKMKFPKS